MEIAIVAKAKQGYIYKYMMENKISLRSLAKEIGFSYPLMHKMLNFKWIPSRFSKNSLKTIQRLENFFKIPIEVLFPPELTKEIAEKLSHKYTKFQEIDFEQLQRIDQKYLVYDSGGAINEISKRLDIVLNDLSKDERYVIMRRFGIGSDAATQRDVANEMGLTRQRIAQITEMAMKNLKKQKYRDFLLGNSENLKPFISSKNFKPFINTESEETEIVKETNKPKITKKKKKKTTRKSEEDVIREFGPEMRMKINYYLDKIMLQDNRK